MAPKPEIPEKKEDLALYEIVANRRQSYDSMMWQTPVLSLTAQAFLLTIALGPESSQAARLISAGLAALAAFASVQLMVKHRYYERADSEWLKKYEEPWEAWRRVHGRTRPFAPRKTFLASWSSFCVWVTILSIFVLAALAVVVFSIWLPELLAIGVMIVPPMGR